MWASVIIFQSPESQIHFDKVEDQRERHQRKRCHKRFFVTNEPHASDSFDKEMHWSVCECVWERVCVCACVCAWEGESEIESLCVKEWQSWYASLALSVENWYWRKGWLLCLPKSFEKLILFRLVDRKTGFGLINSKKLFQFITKPSKVLFLFSISVLPCLGLVPLGQCYTKESRDSNLRHQSEKCNATSFLILFGT